MNYKELGIYIHIPFCKQKCFYCDFCSYENMENKIDKYIKRVKEEITDTFKYLEKKEGLNKYNISTIYIGGGTPSLIDVKYIKQIIEKLKLNMNIKDIEKIEVTIEVNPGTVTKQKLYEYRKVGVNRLSIGLQSANDEILKKLGRIHTFNEFLQTYMWAKELGFENINVDLMLGLPFQKIKDLEDTIKEITNLNPNHISIYSLILEENTLLDKLIKNDTYKMPSEQLERNMYWYVKNKLELLGYNHYEISNFSKKGYESKHNMNCWEQKEYIGIGLAAHSYLNCMRYSNTENMDEYIENKNINKIIHEVQDINDAKKEYMLLGLRKIEGVSITKFKEKYIDNPLYIFKEEIEKLTKDKLIEVDLDNIKLTNKGIDLANLVWEEFV